MWAKYKDFLVIRFMNIFFEILGIIQLSELYLWYCTGASVSKGKENHLCGMTEFKVQYCQIVCSSLQELNWHQAVFAANLSFCNRSTNFYLICIWPLISYFCLLQQIIQRANFATNSGYTALLSWNRTVVHDIRETTKEIMGRRSATRIWSTITSVLLFPGTYVCIIILLHFVQLTVIQNSQSYILLFWKKAI